MKENKTFVITYTKLDGESVTRNGKWTDKCKEFIAKQGHKCLTYIDLDNNNDYRMATNQITDWNIKWNCALSPQGNNTHCVYNDETDPMHDECVYCGQPQERK